MSEQEFFDSSNFLMDAVVVSGENSPGIPGDGHDVDLSGGCNASRSQPYFAIEPVTGYTLTRLVLRANGGLFPPLGWYCLFR